MAGRERQSRPDDDNSNDTPSWIVSWTDMVTLLLSFFVMLQSMAVEKSDMLFQIGCGSFLRAVSGFGIPDWVYGHEPPMPSRQYKRVRHPMERREEARRDRVIDAEAERIRELFVQLRNQVKTEANDLSERPLRYDALDVRFAAGESEADEAQRESLLDYADTLKRNLAGRRINIYVVGLAPEVTASGERAVVSARRALSAANVLGQALAAETAGGLWELHSWGAVDGSGLCRRAGVSAGGTQLVVMITEAK
ncbi:MAG: flagellar motor protein MotB [Phycisphaerae bacterium]